MENSAMYQSYLIRLWPGEREGEMRCRATLHSVRSHEHFYFTDLEGLLTYLRDEEAKLIKKPNAVPEEM
jgi:hypothetical protein